MSDTIVWIHGDCLSSNNPALLVAPGAPAIFVWDDDLLKDWSISLKRVVFIYECLLDLPVTIRRGNVAQEIARFAEENVASRILVAESPSPRFPVICEEIMSLMPKGSRLEVLRVEPLLDYDGHLDLKRFSRYWRKAKPYALK